MDKERERLKCVKTLNKCTVSLNKFGENLKKCKRESKALKQQNNSITILTAKLKELKATKAVRCPPDFLDCYGCYADIAVFLFPSTWSGG